jgi:uncharacterized protein involved in tellurium resistance
MTLSVAADQIARLSTPNNTGTKECTVVIDHGTLDLVAFVEEVDGTQHVVRHNLPGNLEASPYVRHTDDLLHGGIETLSLLVDPTKYKRILLWTHATPDFGCLGTFALRALIKQPNGPDVVIAIDNNEWSATAFLIAEITPDNDTLRVTPIARPIVEKGPARLYSAVAATNGWDVA